MCKPILGQDIGFSNKAELITYWDRFYNLKKLRNNFMSLTPANRITFLELFGDISSDLLKIIEESPDIIKSFKQFYSDSGIIAELAKYSSKEKILFFKKYVSSNTAAFNLFKSTTSLLTHERRYLELYRHLKTYPRIYSLLVSEVLANYGIHGKKLYEKVILEWTNTKNILITGKKLENIMVKSGMSYKNLPDMISVRDNISKMDLLNYLKSIGKDRFEIFDINVIKAIYANFDTKPLHWFLENRISAHLNKLDITTGNLKLESLAADMLLKTGGVPGTHAEVRALNELLHNLEGQGLSITDDLMKDILGFNYKYKVPEVMVRCADCYYITKDIKMIKLN